MFRRATTSSAEIPGLISSTAVLGLISILCLLYIIYLRRRLQRTTKEGPSFSTEAADVETGGHGTGHADRRTLIPFPISLQQPHWTKPSTVSRIIWILVVF
jgi:hypothetical protein